MNNLIVFDLDGVITSEEAYWDAAGLTLHELMYSQRYWNIEGLEMRYATSPQVCNAIRHVSATPPLWLSQGRRVACG